MLNRFQNSRSYASESMTSSPAKRLNAPKLALMAAAALLSIGGAGGAAASAGTVYVSQSGSGDGSSCSSARSAAWFNSSSNWGSGATQIGPGTTVRLCGTITTGLTFQGNGSSSAPITLDGTGATMNAAMSSGNNHSWWRIQNVTWSTSFTGYVMTITGGSNGVFANNTADNIQHGVFLAQYNGQVLPSNISISNNYLRQTAADLGNTQHDIITTEGSTDVVIEGNYLEMRTGGAGNEAHNDAIQTYQKGGMSGGAPANWTIRYNQIVMNSVATNDRSWMMLENLKGTINIYGNLLLGLQGASNANGIAVDASDNSAVFNIYDNTFVSKSSASNNMLNLYAPGVANLKNNIFSATWQTMLNGNMTVRRDHNLWQGQNTPNCAGGTNESCGIDPKFVDYTNNNFALTTSSPALNAGSNLGVGYGKNVAKDSVFPNPTLLDRPLSGNWAQGAFSDQSSNVQLPAPTSLRAS